MNLIELKNVKMHSINNPTPLTHFDYVYINTDDVLSVRLISQEKNTSLTSFVLKSGVEYKVLLKNKTIKSLINAL